MIDETIKVIIKLKVDELLYDIKSRAFLQGDANKGEDTHKAHPLQDIGDSANKDVLLRYISVAIEDCNQLLYAYLTEEVKEDTEVVNTPEEPKNDEYVFDLEMPHAMSKSGLQQLTSQLHEYVVSRVIYEWCAIAFPEGYELWKSRAEDYRHQIKIMHNRRRIPVRLRKNPQG